MRRINWVTSWKTREARSFAGFFFFGASGGYLLVVFAPGELLHDGLPVGG
ncbi:hypothetical protein SAMN05421747_104104 [Parapedobacter composti]|uniref:Uncharacterized protein n=1 Tax=Parapedobacter composti TaxID=623281 RepID=A0A1I1GCT0_9SPHI|nr:hypothetical protein SAMN05421747_104104 [Parapedobacter composti]